MSLTIHFKDSSFEASPDTLPKNSLLYCSPEQVIEGFDVFAAGSEMNEPEKEYAALVCLQSPQTLSELSFLSRFVSDEIIFLNAPKVTDAGDLALLDKMKELLLHKSVGNRSSIVSVSLQELYEQLGAVLTSSFELDKSRREVSSNLESLKNSGFLKKYAVVFSQAKIFNVGKFKEAFLQDEPRLLEFYLKYQEVVEKMSPLESLRETFFQGRTVELSNLSKRLGLTLIEMNNRLQELNAKKLLLSELIHSPTSGGVEFEVELGLRNQQTLSFELWGQSQTTHPAFFEGILNSEAFRPFFAEALQLSHEGITPGFWKELWSFSEKLRGEEEFEQILGALLVTIEETDSIEHWLLWAFLTCDLDIPKLPFERVLELLPDSLSEAGSDLEEPVKRVFSSYLEHEKILSFLLTLPASFQFDWLGAELLEQLAQRLRIEGKVERELSLRQQVARQAPDNAKNLSRLSQLLLEKAKVFQGLELALQANRLEPRKFPMERYLKEADSFLFADLERLREELIKLPAHPALKQVETSLSEREKVITECEPKWESVQKLFDEKKLIQASKEAKKVIANYGELTPPTFQKLVQDVVSFEDDLKKRLNQKYESKKVASTKLQELAAEAQEHGFMQVSRRCWEKVTRMNPNFGLGFLKLARITEKKSLRNDAFEKAVSLAKESNQAFRNLREYLDILKKEKRSQTLVPLILACIDKFDDFSKKWEGALMEIIEHGDKLEAIREQVEEFTKKHNQRFDFRRINKALIEFDNLEPWKKALLTMKSKR